MTSARAYDGGSYSPYSETPIYDRLVAERGRPEIGPFNLPLPDFAMHPLFGERPALPALPAALPAASSYSSPSPAYGASTSGYGYNAPAPMPALPAPLPVPSQYGSPPQFGGAQYNNAPTSGYASMAPAPQAAQPMYPAPQAPQAGAGQYAAQYVQPPQVPMPRVPNMGEPGQFPHRY